MKVNKITTQPEFQPVTLQITIESQEELDTIGEFFTYSFSIPEFLEKHGHISSDQRILLTNMMIGVQDAL